MTTLWRHRGLAAATIVGMVLGCGEVRFLKPEVDVESLAADWPEYQPPVPEGSVRPFGSRPRLQPFTMQQPRPIARVTLPPRIRPYREWDLEETAVDSLVRIGQPAVLRLVQSLRHPQAEVREQAAQLLARIGPDAEQAVPALVVALQDRHAGVQKAAARALGQIGPAAAEAVEPLMSFVHEGSSPVQQAGYEE